MVEQKSETKIIFARENTASLLRVSIRNFNKKAIIIIRMIIAKGTNLKQLSVAQHSP